jgi:hypothetical protein
MIVASARHHPARIAGLHHLNADANPLAATTPASCLQILSLFREMHQEPF